MGSVLLIRVDASEHAACRDTPRYYLKSIKFRNYGVYRDLDMMKRGCSHVWLRIISVGFTDTCGVQWRDMLRVMCISGLCYDISHTELRL
ncbi:hypothetical protein NDU88_003638 [Pleurodeles waltl]|uniref:Uncharacterized protein n=1 Tax=Pleurodeles waltl TaxID=8319 RepID=A0AAV7QG75_PLEWA|nr:hypothetical protein NDU88_003638 [Pleurodeles waltl]